MGFTDYKNNGFQLEKASYWYSQKQQNYSITQIDIRSSEVWLPDTYNYGCVIELDIRSDNIQVYKKARVLHIPAAIKNIRIRNDIFPELERVEIDFANPYYTTDGQMIFSDKGRKLEYCPVCKGDHLIIPDHVKDIGPEAFRGTMYQMIQFPKSYVNVDHRAFDHSRWLEAQGDMAIIGSMLYKASCNRSCLNVPPGIKRFHRNLFGYENTPDKMISSFLPNRRDMYELNKYARCRSFTITSPQANINIKKSPERK